MSFLRRGAYRPVRARALRAFERLDARLLLAGDACNADPADEETKELSDVAALVDDQIRAADAGSTFAGALDLGVLNGSAQYAGSVGGSDPSDIMKFTLNGTSTVTLGLSGLRADIDLYLYNSRGQRVANSNKAGTASESITASLSAGVYYVVVVPWRSALGTYTLSTSGTLASTPTTPTTPTNPTNPTNPTTPTVTPFADVAYYGGSNDWGVNSINAPEAWAHGYSGSGVVVAVVDTGVDLNHPDLVNQLWVNAGDVAGNGIDDDHNGYVDDAFGWDFASGDNNPEDGNGHGTHVAGTIAAAKNGVGATGVAPGAKIMPVRVLNSNGSGTMAAVAAGIRYAADNGADIINLSLGGGFSSVIQTAIQYALQHDVLVVAAAGNEYSSVPGYPARFAASMSNVLSVGAYSSSNQIASFSNDVGTSGAVQVDAPGVSVYSTYMGDRYATLSGTSMATPHVAGLAALALGANPNLTAAQLRTLIVNGANRVIAGSDARGGINAALTVAMAAAGQVSSSSATAASQSAQAAAAVSVRSILARSVGADGALPLAAAMSDATPLAGPTAVANWFSGALPAEVQQVAHDTALAALFSDASEADEDRAIERCASAAAVETASGISSELVNLLLDGELGLLA